MPTDRDSDSASTSGPESTSDPGSRAESGTSAADGGDRPRTEGSGRRDVVVPMRVYKTVTVLSTLIAVLAVVVGFVLLDAATIRLSLLRRLLVAGLDAVGLAPPSSVLSAALAVAGLGAIALGAGVYVLGTRFRAPGMGNPQEAGDEVSDDG